MSSLGPAFEKLNNIVAISLNTDEWPDERSDERSDEWPDERPVEQSDQRSDEQSE